MGGADQWFAGPRRLAWTFALLLVLPALAVAWLGASALARDRDLEARQVREKRTLTADRIATDLARAITSVERLLVDAPAAIAIEPGDDAVVMTMDRDWIEARPAAHLLYQPVPVLPLPEPDDPFRAAEALERGARDIDAAIAAYRTLAVSKDAPTRAGALVRLARAERTQGRLDAALRTYGALGQQTGATVAGLPADLVARRARVALLAEHGRADAVRAEASALRADLLAPRWRLDQATFRLYLAQVDGWAGTTTTDERLALADALAWLRHEQVERRLDRAGRRPHGETTLLWQTSSDRIVALAAGRRFVDRRWVAPLVAEQPSLSVRLLDATGARPDDASGSVIYRSAAEAALPWAIAVTDSAPADTSAADSRQAAIFLGFGLLVVVVGAGAYVVARSVSRELATARLQSEFVSTVSHEFRTPLTALHQFTTLLNDDETLPGDKRRAFHQAQARATNRLRSLVESLLDFQRMEARARPFDFQPTSIVPLVEKVVSEFRDSAAPPGFTIAIASDDARAAQASVDAEAIGRAIWNLLDNAVKYSGDARRVSIDIGRSGRDVRIAVRDEGIGIPAAELETIFTKFSRGSASRTRGIRGTGLGLAMVRHIVDAHGGGVTVDSEQGRGSTFTIWLPHREARAAEPGRSA